MSLQKRFIRRSNALAAAGMPASDMTAIDLEQLWPALSGQGAMWVSARMATKQTSPLIMYCGKGDDRYGGPLNGLANAATTGVAKANRGVIPAFAYGSAANCHLAVEYDLPASYMVYAAWSTVTPTNSAGMVGVGAIDGFRFYSSSTSLGFRHTAAAASDLVAGTNVNADGTTNIAWGCFNAATMTAYLAGMNGAVARLDHYATKVWTVPAPAVKNIHVGSADSVGQAQFLNDAIIVPAALYVTDNDRHDKIVAALAAVHGLTAA